MNSAVLVPGLYQDETAVQFWQSVPHESVRKILKQCPITTNQVFYDPRSGRFYSSNPEGQLICIATLSRLYESNKLVNSYKGLDSAERLQKIRGPGHERLSLAIQDVRICRGCAA